MDFSYAEKPVSPCKTRTYCLRILADWDMRSSRNPSNAPETPFTILADWDMRSSRNQYAQQHALASILADWDMRSSRNRFIALSK